MNPGRPAHAATINWHPGPNTGGLANTYRYEVSADGGAFVPGAGPLPASPTTATVECPGVFLCSYRLTAVSAKGASPVSNTVSHRLQRTDEDLEPGRVRVGAEPRPGLADGQRDVEPAGQSRRRADHAIRSPPLLREL